ASLIEAELVVEVVHLQLEAEDRRFADLLASMAELVREGRPQPVDLIGAIDSRMGIEKVGQQRAARAALREDHEATRQARPGPMQVVSQGVELFEPQQRRGP